MGIHLVAAHAARRDHRILERRIVRDGQHQSLEHLDQAFELRLGDLLDVAARVDVELSRPAE